MKPVAQMHVIQSMDVHARSRLNQRPEAAHAEGSRQAAA